MRCDGQKIARKKFLCLYWQTYYKVLSMITSSHKLISFCVHFLLLDLQELLLQGVVGGGEDGGRQHRVTLLLQHVIHLAVLAAEVEQQTLPLLEHGAANIILKT